MNSKCAIRACLCLILFTCSVDASGATRRFLLAAGANSGGPDRVSLQYAVTDAENFTRIMVGMGGVRSEDRIVLRQPDWNALESALQNLEYRISNLPAGEGRAEILFYYSGHADERGLLMGDDHVSYADLRERIGSIPAAVRITVLDACASGAITRLKGGERRPAFLIDDSTDMEGYAFLTSSSSNEAAQESDDIGASYFTHFLVSGLRGAADVSGEGKISLTEAYQFAFNETLARTTESQGGAQHPAYHINLSGTGDVVMTDVRETSAGLVLDDDLSGRFFIRDQDNHLVAELYKPRGRRMTIGLDEGEYRIHWSDEPDLWVARIKLDREEMLVLQSDHFEIADRMPTVVRGGQGVWPPRQGFLGPLVGRWRLGLIIGKHGVGIESPDEPTGLVIVRAGSKDLLLGLGFGRWLREDLALGLDVLMLEGDAAVDVGYEVSASAIAITTMRIGMKKYGPGSLLRTPFRPFLSMDVQVTLGSHDWTTSGIEGVETGAETLGAFGVVLGTGADVMLGRHALLGTKVAYAALTDFPEPLAGRSNYSSFEATINVCWLFGKGF